MTAPLPAHPLPAWDEQFSFAIEDEATQTVDIALRDAAKAPLGLYRLKIDALPNGVRQEVAVSVLHKDDAGVWSPGDPPNRLVLTLAAQGFGLGAPPAPPAAEAAAPAPPARPTEQAAETAAETTAEAAGGGADARPAEPLMALVGYTSSYRDADARSPGDEDFVPPAVAGAAAVPLLRRSGQTTVGKGPRMRPF